MILTYGDCSKLKGKDWCMLEVRSEKTIEPTLRRIGKAIPSIFRGEAVELFVPVGKRDLDTFDLGADTYLFVRSANFSGLLRLKTITGVVSLVTEGDSNRPSNVIPVPDSYVQGLVRAAEKRFREHSSGVTVGTFVRVLGGETRDFCGTVTAMGNGRAVVRIALMTKSIMLETPVCNLLNLSHVPQELRTYYYCPLVLSLTELGEEAVGILGDHASLGNAPVPIPKRDPRRCPPKRARQRTVTALVKKLILVDGIHLPMEIASKVVGSIKAKEVIPPKSLFIVYTIIKDGVMEHWARKESPGAATYRDLARLHGEAYRISAARIAGIDPNLSIPLGGKPDATAKARHFTNPKMSSAAVPAPEMNQ